jgi:thioredoxin reductase (NADPH)
MIHSTDIVIIGAGPIGLFSVFQAGMLKMKCHVIDSLPEIGGQCQALYPEKPIYDIPGYPSILASDLITKLEEQAAPFHPVYHLDQQVVSLERQSNGSIIVATSKGLKVHAKAIIIAAGGGAFGPNRLPIEGIEEFENKSVFYAVKNAREFATKDIVIAGGGDSAVDWAIELSRIANSVTVIHRRPKFRCAPESFDKLSKLVEEGKIKMEIPYQVHQVLGDNGAMHSVELQSLDGSIKTIKADVLLAFFGLSMDIGPILHWGIELDKHHIKVDQVTMQTNLNGVFAVGDIATYPKKLKLILTGFAESATACHSIYPLVYPDTPLHFEYSTTKGVKVNG